MYFILQLVALETGTVYLDEQFTEKQVVYKDMKRYTKLTFYKSVIKLTRGH